MRTNRFWIVFASIVLGFQFCLFEMQGQVIKENFYYGKRGTRGSVNIKMLAFDKGTGQILNLKNSRGVIDLNNFEGDVQIWVQFRDLKLGLRPDGKNVKYPGHKLNFYLEVPRNESFMPKSQNGLTLISESGIEISEDANLRKRDSKNVIYKVANGNYGGEIKLSFRIVKENGGMWNEDMNFSFRYQVIERQEKIIDPNLAKSDELYQETINSLDQTVKLQKAEEYLAMFRDINPDRTNDIEGIIKMLKANINDDDPEEIAWNNINAALSAENKKVIYEESLNYIEKYPAGKYIEQVYYHAIDNLKKEENQNKLFTKFKSFYPRSQYIERLTQKYQHLSNKKQEDVVENLQSTTDNQNSNSSSNNSAEKKDKRAFEKAKKLNTIIALENYIKEFPEGKHKTEARLLIDELSPLELTYMHMEGNEYLLNISGSGDRLPTLTFSREGARFIRWKDAGSFSQAIVEIPAGTIVTIEVKAGNKRVLEDIDSSLEPLKGDIKGDGKSLGVTGLSGGQPPYFLVFESEGVFIHEKEIGSNQDFTVNVRDLGLPKGTYDVVLTDQSKKERRVFEHMAINPSRNLNGVQLLIAALIAIAVMGITGFFIYRRNLKTQEEEAVARTQEKLEEMQSNEGRTTVSVPSNTSNSSNEEGVSPEDEGVRKRIKVSTKKERELITSSPVVPKVLPKQIIKEWPEELLEQRHQYFAIPLGSIWADSMVTSIFLHRDCAFGIEDFVFNANKELNFRAQDIPEIGGFLLGKKYYNPHTKRYQVSLEKFVDVEPEDNGVYQIEFGDKAYQYLERRKDFYKNEGIELDLVGWFHTHPGHGLFLSRPDQNIQHNWFTNDFQIAMELDSVKREKNPNYDFGFFTWTKDKEINNVENQKGPWPEWESVRSWLRGETATI